VMPPLSIILVAVVLSVLSHVCLSIVLVSLPLELT
jgi:hypothetical protein